MEVFMGSWKLVSSENFDQYMDAISLSGAMKRYGSNMTTVVIFTQDGENIVIKTKMYEDTNRSYSISFKLGEEFNENTIDFRECRTVMNLQDGKLVQLQKWDGEEATIIRQVQDEKMISTFMIRDVVCVRIYEKMW
ncbi:myelin P2 protein-like [Silurus meridionalis]|uniref:myelin P2 protein-like n=1 Tax=Silurus meridionalis TaxID=175797 RepID=UPI001EE9B4F5|nr:myelin P2 protein-like [Silurus meridionalis]